ncbi:MAG: sulfotransferase [Verrucomicrobiota bacterium]|nr:sulfotransferase [Verrucomicrobiota bacterium]
MTWCLGQHPNLLGLEESNWMAPFAVDLAVAFRRGSARGERSQLSSMGIERDQFMQEIGTCINTSIVRHREAFETRGRQGASPLNPENHPAFKISRDESDPKSRWVNGTPEYSFGIAGLGKLFPEARFIHLVRNPDLVVPSMRNFDRVARRTLAQTDEEGYASWQAHARACVLAEDALGEKIVCRAFLEDLVSAPEKSLQQIFDFIEEPFAEACLEPLQKRINSSNVAAAELQRDPEKESAVFAEAREFWKTLRATSPPKEPLPEAAALMEEQFEHRVAYAHDLDANYALTRRAHLKLQEEFHERTQWALQLKEEAEQRAKRILELQNEIAERTRWTLQLKEEVAQRDRVILQVQKELAERTEWALALQAENARKDELILRSQGQTEESAPPPSDV